MLGYSSSSGYFCDGLISWLSLNWLPLFKYHPFTLYNTNNSWFVSYSNILLCIPLLSAGVAKQILDDLIEANKEYWPELK